MFVSFISRANKTSKLKGANINAIPTLIGIVCCLEIVWFGFAKVKGAEIILHAKSPTFRAANLKFFYSMAKKTV